MTENNDLSGPGDDDRPEQTGGGWSTDGLAYLQKKVIRQRVFVLHPYLKDNTQNLLVRSPEARLEEALGLAAAINVDLVGGETTSLRTIKPATYLGSGKLADLKAFAKSEKIDLIVFDCELSPIQQRNLERELKVKVIDRTALILEIFGDRASTKEGELQVELAHLVYQRSRLVRSWTHLERQRGGSGFLGGPGETQIEADRRIIADRITRIKRQLTSVTRTRNLHRAQRQKTPYPIVALVGYTNAGKSTLFNRLTDADVLAEDMLFATLDPTMRSIMLPSGRKIIMSDTVGFISELPTTLVAAFRATLEEVLEADLIVHVRDASHPDSDIQKQDVEDVLAELGVELNYDLTTNNCATPVLEAMNKCDLVPSAELEQWQTSGVRNSTTLPVSGLTGAGCEAFIAALDTALSNKDLQIEIIVPFDDGQTPAWLHANSKINKTEYTDDGTRYNFTVDPVAWGKYSKGTSYWAD